MTKSQFTPVLEDKEKCDLIIRMAKWYTSFLHPFATMNDVAKKFDVASQSVSKYFSNFLPKLDGLLYDKVQQKKAFNKKRVQFRK